MKLSHSSHPSHQILNHKWLSVLIINEKVPPKIATNPDPGLMFFFFYWVSWVLRFDARNETSATISRKAGPYLFDQSFTEQSALYQLHFSHLHLLRKKCFLTNNKFWLKRMLLSNLKIYEIANSVIDAVQMTQKFLISIVIPQLGQIFWHLHFHDKGRKFSEVQPMFFENRRKFWNNHKHRFCNFSL